MASRRCFMQTQRVGILTFKNEGLGVNQGSRDEGVLGEKEVKDRVDQDLNTTSPMSADKKNKALPIITAAVAIVSLGVSAYAAKGRGKAVGALEEYKKVADAEAARLKGEITKLENDLKNKVTSSDVANKIDELKNRLGAIENSGVKEELIARINAIKSGMVPVGAAKPEFPFKTVDINGKDFTLAHVLNPLRADFEGTGSLKEMQATLRSEAARRMFGFSRVKRPQPEHGVIRIPTSEYKGIASAGGMAAVPKEIAQNLSKIIAGKQDMKIVVDMPLYRGAVEKSAAENALTLRTNDLVEKADGTYEYIQNVVQFQNGVRTKSDRNTIAKLKKIDSMELKVLDEARETVQKVDMYMSETKLNLDFDTVVKNANPKVKEMINSMKKGETRDYGTLELTKDKDGKMQAFAKVRTVFYDNGSGGKFDLNVPLDQVTNIYNDVAISSGESERFAYFAKYFYENITKAETAKFLNKAEAGNYLGADMILGNDWQCGPIAAMMRQLTTARKYYNNINPNVADKLYDMPIITIMHNAGLTGRNWHSQSKMLNVLFGEHAATIAENSHMPNLYVDSKNAGLAHGLWSGLMDGHNVNPQVMGDVYSDLVIPVSTGYSKEMATNAIFGGERTEIFKFRSREGFYSDIDNLRQLAAQNGIKVSEVKELNPTMFGITNGSDRANNMLTAKEALKLAQDLKLPDGTFTPYEKGMDVLEWHNKNKMAGINKMIADIESAKDPVNPNNIMLVEMPFETDLSGVTEKTPMFVSAGRIVDQKGLDIFADSIIEFYKNFKGTEYPVFYAQGIGDPKYKEAFLHAKREVAKTNPEAAKRIVFANVFSEPGRFNLAKLVSDWSVMPSWFEPCGLSHKEIGMFSGAGSVVNNTGGLAADLTEGVNVIVSKFNPERSKLHENGQNFAKALQEAVNIHADQNKYREVVESMMNANFDWARKDGPIEKYIDAMNMFGLGIVK